MRNGACDWMARRLFLNVFDGRREPVSHQQRHCIIPTTKLTEQELTRNESMVKSKIKICLLCIILNVIGILSRISDDLVKLRRTSYWNRFIALISQLLLEYYFLLAGYRSFKYRAPIKYSNCAAAACSHIKLVRCFACVQWWPKEKQFLYFYINL